MCFESDKYLVQIVMIYKLKGLEYLLVWLLFIINFCVQEQVFYYDCYLFEVVLDFNVVLESVDFVEVECLVEDLCLFYVVLICLVWYCSFGVVLLVCCCGDKKGDIDVY